jgi:phospholipid-binding lipoprotein MlaA
MTGTRLTLRAGLVAASLLLAGCANTHPSSPLDPYESFNRSMYAFNDKADRWVIKPAPRATTPSRQAVPHRCWQLL